MSSPKSPKKGSARLRGFAAVIKLTYRPMRIDTRGSASASFRLTDDVAH